MPTFRTNGRRSAVDVPPETLLLWVLREELQLPGTKFGCGKGLCGAGTVHADGQPTRSCLLPVAAAEGRSVTTIEGLGDGRGGLPGATIASKGSLDLGPGALEAVDELPFLADATMEPQNRTVRLAPDACEVWVPTQSPGLVVPAVKQLTGLAADRIGVNCTSLGGCCGPCQDAISG